ncbi:FkbM family methyltransferase [uncultured Mycobacterium sp.]|uniref:FkbM family methyltransferase n=1 Tax=uncultured Mycobacterium sp. TaxID=171292 RepID=UPI0035C99A9C
MAPYRAALLRHRVAAAVEHEEALAALTLRTVVDVGANRGQFALFALHSFPAARIVSLEPLATPAARFRRVFAKERRVTLHHAALGPETGQFTMHVSRHDDSSSLLPITATQGQLFRGTDEVRTETVRTAPLSEFLDGNSIQEPALLKLDVQGYELEALRACGELLDKFAYVCAEGSFIELYEGQVLADDLVAWLREHGYELVRGYGAVSDEHGQTIQADMLFKRTDDRQRGSPQ